jgi:hypothetical protein
MKLFEHNVLTWTETAATLSIIRMYQIIAKLLGNVQNISNELLLTIEFQLTPTKFPAPGGVVLHLPWQAPSYYKDGVSY